MRFSFVWRFYLIMTTRTSYFYTYTPEWPSRVAMLLPVDERTMAGAIVVWSDWQGYSSADRLLDRSSLDIPSILLLSHAPIASLVTERAFNSSSAHTKISGGTFNPRVEPWILFDELSRTSNSVRRVGLSDQVLSELEPWASSGVLVLELGFGLCSSGRIIWKKSVRT